MWLPAEDGFEAQRFGPLRARSSPLRIERLVDRRPSVVDPIVAQSRKQGFVSVLSPSAWTIDDVPGPNVTDKDTILTLALMAADAYVETPGEADWEDVGAPFNRSLDFGWEGDGLRGHVFADETNSTIVIGLKGTSVAVFDGDGTTTNDKINDNLFFSCCCAQQGPWTWHQVCDCATGTYTCNNTCVVQALRDENRYYYAARELYANVTEIYPNSNVWITGHSLGGAVSSFLGLTYGVPVVTFQAVPEALPAKRLGLPVPPGADPDTPQEREYTGAFHFGHTADPVYIGACNGATASCSLAGYAFEAACHTGHECVYDTVGDLGWRVGIGTHRIKSVIRDVILKYDTVPECKLTPECRECGNWKMYESNGTEPTTTSSVPTTTTTKTRTRTETCKTPYVLLSFLCGWECLADKYPGAGGVAWTKPLQLLVRKRLRSRQRPRPRHVILRRWPQCVAVAYYEILTSARGWFGCKDKTTTTETTTDDSTSTTSTTTSTTCKTPGRFWGCYDKTTTTSTTVTTTTTTTTSSSTASEDQSTITPPPSMPSPTSAPTSTPAEEGSPRKRRCVDRAWYGLCRKWEGDDHETIDDI